MKAVMNGNAFGLLKNSGTYCSELLVKKIYLMKGVVCLEEVHTSDYLLMKPLIIYISRTGGLFRYHRISHLIFFPFFYAFLWITFNFFLSTDIKKLTHKLRLTNITHIFHYSKPM